LGNSQFIAIKKLIPRRGFNLKTEVYIILREVEMLDIVRDSYIEDRKNHRTPINTTYYKGCQFTPDWIHYLKMKYFEKNLLEMRDIL